MKAGILGDLFNGKSEISWISDLYEPIIALP